MGLWQSSDHDPEPTVRCLERRQRLHNAAVTINEFLCSRECAVAITAEQSLGDYEQVLFLLRKRMRYVPRKLYDAAALAHYTTRWLHLRILCRKWCVPREVEAYAVAYFLAMVTRRGRHWTTSRGAVALRASMATQGT